MQEVIVIVDAEASKRTRLEVAAKVKEGKCLICECVSAQRGLCMRHYHQWYHSRKVLNKRERAAFDARLIREGKLLDANAVSQIRRANAFQLIAQEIVG